MCTIYFFRQIPTFLKVRVAFVFGLHTLQLKDFSKIYQLKGLKPKNKDHVNFYECCDLTKKVYLIYIHTYYLEEFAYLPVNAVLMMVHPML